MGKEIIITSLEEMCDLMCDNKIPEEPYICDSCKNKENGWDTEPCDGCCKNHSGYEPTDAVSRDAVWGIIMRSDFVDRFTYQEFTKKLDALPSVTVTPHRSGKWDRLYNWLNDMRFGIAPDETVTDIDERHCRESQTDLLDEIMEWMIKAEGSGEE